MLVCAFFFRRYRNLAQGFALAGVGAGMFGIPPLVSWAEKQNGSNAFFIAIACCAAQLFICATVMRPSQLEIRTKRNRLGDVQNQKKPCLSMLNHYIDLLRNFALICLSLSALMLGFGIYTVFVYLPYYVIEKGTHEMQSSMLLSICGICSIFGRIMIGIIANTEKILEIHLQCACLTFLSINCFVFPLFSNSYSGQVAFAIVTGLFFGGPFVMMTPAGIRILGMEKVAAAVSIELGMCGVGSLIGSLLAGRYSFNALAL